MSSARIRKVIYRSRLLPTNVGMLGAFSFVFSVAVAVFIDPIVFSTLSFSPFRYWVLALGTIIVYILVSISNSDKNRSPTSRGLRTFLATSIPGIASAILLGTPSALGTFLTPHLGVLAAALSYSILVGFVSFVYNYKIDLPEVEGRDVDPRAKIARVELEFELWFRTLILILTVIIVAASVTVFQSLEISERFFGGDIKAAQWVHYGISLQAAYFAILVVAFGWLMLRKLNMVSGKLGSVKIEASKAT